MRLYICLLWTWLRACCKPLIEIGNSIELTVRVWPQDLDINGHMNNSRHVTIIDLALIECLTLTETKRRMTA